jgi:hypothetical protein
MPASLGSRRNAINEKTRQMAGFKGFQGLYWLSVELEMVPEPGIEPGRPYERGILSPYSKIYKTVG